jgi:hypothetical protein
MRIIRNAPPGTGTRFPRRIIRVTCRALRTRVPVGAPLALAALGWWAARRPALVPYRPALRPAPPTPIGDTDRDQVLDDLAQHAGDGRITLAEHRDRCGRAFTANTRSDLDHLLADLPVPDHREHRARR